MPVKRRRSKRRELLDDDTRAWLRGEDGFTQFLPLDELAALWAEHGNPLVATFDPKSGATWPVE